MGLKKRLGGVPIVRRKASKPAFVELITPPATLPEECVIEFECAAVTLGPLLDILVVDLESMSGDVKATSFVELYDAYARDVFRFALYLSGDTALAQDITSETFLRVWLAEQPVRPGSVKAWLFAIARNLYLHELRHLCRNMPLDSAMPSVDSVSATPEATLEAKENLVRVLKALATLPEVDRFALLLRVEGFSYTEIAASLRISIAAAKVKVHRARLRLASQGLGGNDNEHIERRHS
jgi:RNA polymerase sigma-70 factor (ECF subfamily)